MPVIEIENLLVMRNNKPALDIPLLLVDEGTIVSLIGPNGAGKSTLLLSLMRLIRPDAGEIRFQGTDIFTMRSLHRLRRNMSMVFQEPLLFSTSVYANVASGLKMRGMKGDDIRLIVDETMELLGITHLAKRPAARLSGGEAQRVNLARALAVRPRLLLMDEPFTGLDAPTRESLIDDIEKIIRMRNITAVMATHDRNEAIRLSDKIILLNNGRIIQTGTSSDITQNPVDEFVATFMGTETILSGTVTGAGNGVFIVSVNGNSVEVVGSVDPGSNVTFCIHPENIIFSDRTPSSSARNSFLGKVVKVVSIGLYQKIYFDCGFTLVAYITNQSQEMLCIREGTELNASFKATSVHIIKIV